MKIQFKRAAAGYKTVLNQMCYEGALDSWRLWTSAERKHRVKIEDASGDCWHLAFHGYDD